MKSFDLEKAVKEWKQSLVRNGKFEDGVIAELSDHLQHQISQLIEKGLSPNTAFEKAIKEFGDIGELGYEEEKVNKKEAGPFQIRTWLKMMLFKNYINSGIRSLYRDKLYTFTSFAGLIVGLVAFFLIALYVTGELSYDQFHNNKQRIYRVIADLKTSDNLFHFAVTPPQLGAFLKEDFGEITHSVRFWRTSRRFNHEGEVYEERNLLYTDPDFFNVFSFKLIKGNPQFALQDHYNVVVTESFAKKYFGDSDPVGKTLDIQNDSTDYLITGVVEDPPKHSHLQFDMLISISTLFRNNPNFQNGWFFLSAYTYILLDQPESVSKIEAELDVFRERRYGEAEKAANQFYTFKLQPLDNVYFDNQLDANVAETGNLNYVKAFSLIGVLILIIACLNYINLVTANSGKRAKEIGVRKTIGATKKQLRFQFLIESTLMVLLAGIISWIIIWFTLPAINNYLMIDLSIFDLNNQFYLSITGVLLVIGLLTGLYPSFILSSMKPVTAFKVNLRGRTGKSDIRRILVGIQLMISTGLIASTLLISSQIKNLINFDLGYDREAVLILPFNYHPQVQSKLEYLKNEFRNIPGISQVAASIVTPDNDAFNWYAEYEANNGETKTSSIYGMAIDPDFIDLYDLEIIAGRGLSYDFANDSTTSFILNEAAVKFFGWETPENAIGKKFKQVGRDGEVIGIVKDFHFQSLHQKIEALAMFYSRGFLANLSLKFQTEDIGELISNMESTWKKAVPQQPFSYYFLDQGLQERYESETRLGRIFDQATYLCLLITCFGLISLAAFMMEQKRKELGLRKVFGASNTSLIRLYLREFLVLSLIALLVTSPIVYYLTNDWLQTFPYRIPFYWWHLFAAGIITVAITVGTVSLQTLRAAAKNPVKNLRDE